MPERQPDAFILERDDEAEKQQEDDRLDEVPATARCHRRSPTGTEGGVADTPPDRSQAGARMVTNGHIYPGHNQRIVGCSGRAVPPDTPAGTPRLGTPGTRTSH